MAPPQYPADTSKENHVLQKPEQRQEATPVMTTTATTATTSPQLPAEVVVTTSTNHTIALSMQETILLSSSGDVLISRCRSCPYPAAGTAYQWQDNIAMMCCEVDCDDLSRQMLESSHHLCSPTGLLGGSPAAKVSPVSHHEFAAAEWNGLLLRGGSGDKRLLTTPEQQKKQQKEESLKDRAQMAFNSPPLVDTGFDEDDSLVPIKSFDYSHFQDGGNDMLPPPNTLHRRPLTPYKKSTGELSPLTTATAAYSPPWPMPEPIFLHGVPTFLPAFSQVKITIVSAHPTGSHCLFISAAGLLYSYGLNNYGQLGIGLKTTIKCNNNSTTHGDYISTPTIVTPLLENGGKAVSCAAGVSHSLVVVETEEQRLTKSRSLNSLEHQMEAVMHHQLYGFGRNDFMKIGLVSPRLAKPGSRDDMERVSLPRRVALRCKLLPATSFRENKNFGIFAVEASAEHSAALVRRASGDVELYTWGNAMHGALGLPQNAAVGTDQMNQKVVTNHIHVVPVPSFVAALSRSSNPHARAACLLLRGEYPTGVSLGQRCTFVTTSFGRCFSFGSSQDGMLGLGARIYECPTPSEIALPGNAKTEFIRNVRPGASSVVATTRSGAVLGWGVKRFVGLLGDDDCSDDDNAILNKLSSGTSGSGEENSVNKALQDIQWSPKRIPITCCDEEDQRIVQASVGFDNAVFVTEAGRVLSCGKASGRLGVGEIQEDVLSPQHMYGGLSLWHTQHPHIPKAAPVPTPTTRPLDAGRKQLRRRQTVV